MRTPEQRFWEKVEKSDGCWEWTCGTAGQYGQFRRAPNDRIQAHRYSWELHFGPIPPGVFVCHHCDNKICVRPDHLFLGTQADNLRDHRLKNGRIGCIKLDQFQVKQIRHLIKAFNTNYSEIAPYFKVTPSQIRNIVNKKSWKHI